MRRTQFLAAVLVVVGLYPPSARADRLWEIGKEDGHYNEFALAEKGLGRFDRGDPLFLVGTSDPAKDWPFVHPGPGDAWAGRQAHTFGIAFALGAVAAGKGECTLTVWLVDTNPNPPHLTILINGRSYEVQTPPGEPIAGASARGRPDLGKPHRFDVRFPAELLNRGANLIDIVNDKGSWMLYDALALDVPAGARLEKLETFTAAAANDVRGLIERDGKRLQPVAVTLRHVGPETVAAVRVGTESARQTIKEGSTEIDLLLPAVVSETSHDVTVEADARTFKTSVAMNPVRKMTVYVLPHSHNDIGYTDLQANIEKKQMNNLRLGMELAEKTADYPPGARFVWNVEVLWSAERFMAKMPEADRRRLMEAIKRGRIALNGMYANELTGLCRPEELVQLFRPATRFAEQCGVTIDSAMLSDVPGMTWGTCAAMAQAGIRYFSIGPNNFDRIGSIMVQWQDKPFWWVAPDGKQKVLVWAPWHGYGMSHFFHEMDREWVGEYQKRLDSVGFPYDISYIRWVGRGDNSAPDPSICEFIKTWNAKYAWPKFVISTVSDVFAAFEKRYGDKLPQFKGDLTPYWEDGAGSSALETAINRNNSDRLVQAEALFAMRKPADFPVDLFVDAWRNVLLYSEHTWGASMSVTDPQNVQSIEQWKAKRGFALEAEKQSRELIERALAGGGEKAESSAVDVFNTSSWPRSELVIVPKSLGAAGDRVTDQAKRGVPSQRLATGELAFMVRDVPPFSAARFAVTSGEAAAPRNPVTLTETAIENGLLHARVDEKTGDITELTARGIDGSFAQASPAGALNQYAYLAGGNLADLRTSGPAKVTISEKGPLVASLRVESDAPGCNRLTREIRLVAGADHLDLINTIDKKPAPISPNPKDRVKAKAFAQSEGKESVSFVYPFDVRDGQIRLDIPFAMIRPDADQLPAACKDWFPVGRWADVSNEHQGITLATIDAPLIELGRLSPLLGSQTDPDVWRKQIEPTQKIFSWVMNNYWSTNYRAYQDGVATFRYALRPHGRFEPAETARFATALSQPLVVSLATGPAPGGKPLLSIEPGDVLVTALKPADDGKGWIVRLFGASGEERRAKMSWPSGSRVKLWRSDTSEKPGEAIDSEVAVPGWGLVTLRAESQSLP